MTTPVRITAWSAPPGAARPTLRPRTEARDTVALSEAPPQEAVAGWKRRGLAAGLLALAGFGVAAGVAGATLLHGPICEAPAPPVQITREGVCVSPSTGTGAATAWRSVRASFDTGETLDDLVSTGSRHYPAPADADPPRQLLEDGRLRVVSWNLHHGQSPDAEGSREQLPEMIAHLRGTPADVYLLQEVPPWRAPELVDQLGMEGYYTATVPGQGNLVLVHPELEVEGNFKAYLTYEVRDREHAGQILHDNLLLGTSQPRVAQALRVRLPGGGRALVWNTHLTHRDYWEGQRDHEAAQLLEFLDRVARPGELTVGGGDLNAGGASGVLEALRSRGHAMDGARIDWLGGRNLPEEMQVSHRTLEAESGMQLSDHPMLAGEVGL